MHNNYIVAIIGNEILRCPVPPTAITRTLSTSLSLSKLSDSCSSVRELLSESQQRLRPWTRHSTSQISALALGQWILKYCLSFINHLVVRTIFHLWSSSTVSTHWTFRSAEFSPNRSEAPFSCWASQIWLPENHRPLGFRIPNHVKVLISPH